MFFEDGLQSGIGFALRESKCVACFVRGTDAESKLWEDEYLHDEEIAQALATAAVTLRMDAGSQEAGFLSAYHPISTTPSLVIIRGGQLLLDLSAGIAKEQFKADMLRTLGKGVRPGDLPTSSSTAHTTASAEPTAILPASETPTVDPNLPAQAISPTPPTASNGITSTPSNTATHTPTNSTVQDMLADRRRRLETDKREKEAFEKAERRAKAEARREALESAPPDSARAEQASYAQQQRKRQQEAQLERERIIRQIESDKQARREKEELRKALAKAEAEGHDGAGGLIDKQLAAEQAASKPRMSKKCALQVRLMDGSTIRSKFSLDQTLRTNVRAWVDEQRSDGDTPYTFKQILTPLPNRTIEISEEDESLQSLGLTPSATLIMLPVQGYAAAYTGDPGLVSRGLSAGYNVLSAGAGMVTGVLGTFLGVGQAPQQEPATTRQTSSSAPDSRARVTGNDINIRTLHDQGEGHDDHQLYNGNQLNFEPRRDRGNEVD